MYSISKQLINTSETITNHWYPCYRDHLLGKLHCGTTQTTLVRRLTKNRLTNVKLWFANKYEADQHYQGASSGYSSNIYS